MTNTLRRIYFYAFIVIFYLISLNSVAFSAEQKSCKWLYGSGKLFIRVAQDFKFSISGQKITVKRENKIIIDHDFQKPIICVVPSPLFPYLAVFVSRQENIQMLESFFKEKGEYPPLEFSADSLYFIDIPNKSIKLWCPKGDIYFSDWVFDIWSKKGNYVALSQDHYGPIHIYRTKDFVASFDISPYRIVYGRKSGSEDPAKVTKFLRWESENIFIYSIVCCGDGSIRKYNILSGEDNFLQSLEGR